MTNLKIENLKPAILCLCLCFLFFSNQCIAQNDTTSDGLPSFQVEPPVNVLPPLRIAVLSPLYLDSAFDNFEYKLSNVNIPQYIMAGLEFYNGAMMAIDSLQKEGVNIEVWVFDTKKKGQTTEQLISQMKQLHFSLIIASFSGTSEQKTFSNYSLADNIPLISATYPNDAYLSGNPFFIMVNSSLKTHLQGIYNFVKQGYITDKTFYITKKGALENKIHEMFGEAGINTSPLRYKLVQIDESPSTDLLSKLLDSTKQNVIICGSLDERFGSGLIRALDEMLSFRVTVIGLPTWDGLKALKSTSNPNLEIIYTTPYNYPKTAGCISLISESYKNKFNAPPGDMVFKGYETMYHFSHLLEKYNTDLLNHLSDTSFKLTNDFLFKPVKQNATSFLPDFMENKKLNFVHVNQGNVIAIK